MTTAFGRFKSGWLKLRKRYWLSLLLDAGLLIAVLVGIHAWNTRLLPNHTAMPALPSITLEGIESGIPEGKTGVVYFFAPWCFYCRNSIDNLENLVRDGDIAWARAVALDYSSTSEVSEFIQETGWTQLVLMGDRVTAGDWNIAAYPTYFVIDGNGRIVSRSVGYSTRAGLWARTRMASWR